MDHPCLLEEQAVPELLGHAPALGALIPHLASRPVCRNVGAIERGPFVSLQLLAETIFYRDPAGLLARLGVLFRSRHLIHPLAGTARDNTIACLLLAQKPQVCLVACRM